MSKVIDNIEDIASIDNHIGLSGITAYHLYNGTVEATNKVITNGFSTTLYTGNGSTQSINTGVDMSTQWGNDASETYGGLVWVKKRSGGVIDDNGSSNVLFDTVRGNDKRIITNSTVTEGVAGANQVFNSTGFSLNTALDSYNASPSRFYTSWNFQTTHRRTGTTNHGKTFTEHYNPFTGFTIIKYEGSGIAGHEIPHSLGQSLSFWQIKSLSNISNWTGGSVYTGKDQSLYINLTNAQTSDVGKWGLTSSSAMIVNSTSTDTNASTYTYILYGWANSYFDEANTLIGNYEIGVYQGTGASGNKVTTRGKPAWVMTKRLDSTSNWYMFDNQRNNISGLNDGLLYTNLSNAERTDLSLITFSSDGFTINETGDSNTLGGQYLYMCVYDNDSCSGKSKYPKATDSTTLNINATVPLASGVDENGTKVKIVQKNETINVSLTEGKNYIAWVGE